MFIFSVLLAPVLKIIGVSCFDERYIPEPSAPIKSPAILLLPESKNSTTPPAVFEIVRVVKLVEFVLFPPGPSLAFPFESMRNLSLTDSPPLPEPLKIIFDAAFTVFLLFCITRSLSDAEAPISCFALDPFKV